MAPALSTAGTVVVTPADEALRPGMASRLFVAALDEDNLPLAEAPTLAAVDGEALISYKGTAGRGVYEYVVTPPARLDSLTLSVDVGGARFEHQLPVKLLPISTIGLPRRLVGDAGKQEFEVLLTGDDLPPAESLQVSLAEGRVESVDAHEQGLMVKLQLEDSPYPRVIAFGVRDSRKNERPLWSAIRLRARPRLPLDVEPGSTAEFSVGNRTYGPFRSDEDGQMVARVVQYPGERAAEVRVLDTLGNETHTNIPLPVHYHPSIAMLPSGPQGAEGPSPVVFLHAVDGDGHIWRKSSPQCRTPLGPVVVYGKAGSGWWFSLPRPTGEVLDEQRVLCSLSRDTAASTRVPVAKSAGNLRLRIWPEDLAADFPVAEFQLALEDLRGERIPATGLQVSAERGEVRLFSQTDDLLRGEYDGSSLLDGGPDMLHVRYDAAPGEGSPSSIVLGYNSDPVSDEVDLYARVLNVEGSPLTGVPTRLTVGGIVVEALTGQHGWAMATLPIPGASEAFVIEASTAYRHQRTIGTRGGRLARGPGSPDIVVERRLTILPGAVEGIELSVDPPIMYLGQRSTAFVRILFLDRVGIPVVDEPVTVEASEGKIGELQRQSDGSFVAEYQPEPHQSPRVVSITARLESTGRSASTRLELQPSPVNGAIGLNIGVLTNISQARPVGGLTIDWRTALLDRTVMFRFGIGQTWEMHDIPTEVGGNGQVKLLYYPVEMGLLLRRDDVGRAFWLGVIGTVWPYWAQVRFGNDVVGDGFGVIPGAGLVSGVGWRLGFGELFLEARGYAVPGPQGDLNYGGNAGGLAAALGYRVVY